MNENEMERLFAGYRDSLGRCGRVPVRAPWRLGWRLAAVGALSLSLGFALWPADAAARAMQRMADAIRNARTMEMVFESRGKTGRWTTFQRLRTSGPLWRHEGYRGPYAGLYIGRDGRRLTSLDRLDHATVGTPPEGDYMLRAESPTALDFAKEWIDSGSVGIERKMVVREHAPVAGRETYLLVFDREEDGYHGEILVDSTADLPLSAWYREGPQGRFFRQTYRFNAPMPTSLFEPPKGKPVVDLQRAQADLSLRWSRPLAVVGDSQIRDACVTDDGTVWITATVSDGQAAIDLPSDLNGPDRYARLPEILPSAGSSDYAEFRLDGRQVVTVGLVPLDPDARPGPKASVRFTRRKPRWVNYWTSEKLVETPVGDPVALSLRRVSGRMPESFVALALDHFGVSLPSRIWEVRAGALERERRFAEAGRAYEQCAAAYRSFIPSQSRGILREAARCYDMAVLRPSARSRGSSS